MQTYFDNAMQSNVTFYVDLTSSVQAHIDRADAYGTGTIEPILAKLVYDDPDPAAGEDIWVDDPGDNTMETMDIRLESPKFLGR